MSIRMNLHRVAFLVFTISVCTGAVIARDSEPVWYWFASCGGPEMTIEAQLDGIIISRTIFPICHALRDSIPIKEPQKIIEFSFRPKRSIAWTGYRDENDETKADEVIKGSFWQAGADPDALLLRSVLHRQRQNPHEHNPHLPSGKTGKL